MNYIILDLEASCWRDRSIKNQSEIIEIGAVKINSDFEIEDEFAEFIQPELHPQLSDFCTELTSITQSDVDHADDFAAVINRFWDWIDIDKSYLLCSWGFYDKSQFKSDCNLHNMDTNWLKSHISLKHQYSKMNHLKRPIGMKGALKKEGISLEGTHHRGIDDARNIAKIFQKYGHRWRF